MYFQRYDFSPFACITSNVANGYHLSSFVFAAGIGEGETRCESDQRARRIVLRHFSVKLADPAVFLDSSSDGAFAKSSALSKTCTDVILILTCQQLLCCRMAFVSVSYKMSNGLGLELKLIRLFTILFTIPHFC